MARARGSPAERVRERLRTLVGDEAARAIPVGHHRIGRVLIVRLPESARPHFAEIGRAYREVVGADAVLRYRGPAAGERRLPNLERISGASTETVVTEHGVRYRLDAARTMFSRGNAAERARAGTVTRPGETVVDLFAGIGYFVVPALAIGRAARAYAVEENPESYRFLLENLRANGVSDRAVALLGDNREVPLPVASADRVFLGLLPTSVPWIPLALRLARPRATLHVHLIVDSRDDRRRAIADVESAIGAAGGHVESSASRRVKAYGPGRSHVVVDAVVTPREE
jgi:tRNA wybutosine-synthesizing protein 2